MFAVHKDNENVVCYVINFKQNFVNYKITLYFFYGN